MTERMLEQAETPASASDWLLEVDDLRTYFYMGAGIVKAVQGVSFHLNKGETLWIAGESGRGKGMTV